MTPHRVDLLVSRAQVVTLEPERPLIEDGALAIADGALVAVGPAADVEATHEPARTLDARGLVALPGLVNAHVHLTGPSLFPGIEPGDSPFEEHFPRWVVPAHEASEPEDERAAARLVALQMLRTGTTAFVEAGVCRFPEAVLDGLAALGIRGAIGVWAADLWPFPVFAPRSVAEALERMDAALELGPPGLVEVWPNVVGHDGCSDELWLGAAERARELDLGWTFHISAFPDDRGSFRKRAGADPLVHLERLGVLDERAVIAHAIHLTEAEIGVLERTGASVAFCPGAALRLASGVARAGRHDRLPHVTLGTDTQNVSDHLDLLRAGALACDLYGEIRGDRTTVTPAQVLDWVTRGGARALGREHELGSLAPGKRADFVVVDARQPIANVENALVRGAPRVVHVFVDGRQVVEHGRVPDEEAIVAEAVEAARRVARRAGLPERTGWLACDNRTA